MNKSQLIRDYIQANNISDDFPNKTIARVIFEKYPNVFPNVENARSIVRLVRGNFGLKNKLKNDKNNSFYRENRNPAIVGKELNLKPIKVGHEPITYKYKKPLILSDIHFPYHNLDALLLSLEHGIKKGVDSIYLNGDVLDCASISRFLKDGSALSFNEERDMFFDFIRYLQENINLPITFKMGNHEDRWEHYLKRNAPEVSSMTDFSFKSILKLDELGIDFVESRQKVNMGKLIVIHGHEFGESVFSPVNPARGLFLRAKSSVLAGHNHQTSEHHENNLKGDSMACFSTGALCQLNPNYRPFAYTKWNLGFAIVEISEDGSFHVDNLRINQRKDGSYFVS